jgi:hypothetical protein
MLKCREGKGITKINNTNIFFLFQKQKNEELNRIMGELAVSEGSTHDNDDLLDLMDQA